MIRHNAAINVTTYHATVSECVFQLLVNTAPYYNNLLFECASSKIRLIAAIFYKSPLPNTENMINQRQDTGTPRYKAGTQSYRDPPGQPIADTSGSIGSFLSDFALGEKKKELDKAFPLQYTNCRKGMLAFSESPS